MSSRPAKALPVFPLIAIAFFAVLMVVFSGFVFDESRLMLNSDILNGLGSRYLRAAQLILPEWDDSRLGGLPTLDALFGDAYHPLVLVQFVMDPARAVGFKFILTIWIAFLSAFTLGRYLTQEWKWGALLGFLYAFNPQYFTHVYGGHDGKMMVFAMAPAAAYFLLRTLRDGSLLHTFYLALALVWMVLTSHLQLTYYFLWGAGFLALFETYRLQAAWKTRAFRLALAALALAASLMATSFQVIPPYLYTTQQSVRGTDEKSGIGHAASWSLHQEELAAMLIPGFIGVDVHDKEPTAQDNRYWGHNSFKLNADSAGALLTFLAFLGLFVPGNRRSALFWLLGSAIALSCALGAHSPLFRLWYNILPGMKSFRAPSMTIFWIPLAMIFMAAPVLKLKAVERAKLLPGAVLFLALLLLTVVARYSWITFLGPVGAVAILLFAVIVLAVFSLQDRNLAIRPNSIISAITQGLPGSARLEQLALLLPFLLVAFFFLSGENLVTDPDTASYFRSLDQETMQQLASTIIPAFLLVTGVAVCAWILLGKELSPSTKALALAVVAAVELYAVDHAFVQTVPRDQYYQPEHPVLASIRQDSPDSLRRPRLLSVTRQPSIKDNIFPAYGMRNALGFHDNELASYREFRGGPGAENFLRNPQDNAFLNLANIGYIIYESPQGLGIMKNSNAMGNAVLYGDWQRLDHAQIVPTLQNPTFDYHRILLLEKDPGIAPQGPVQGTARLQDGSHSDELIFAVQSDKPALLMVSGNYHPYWEATVNGKKVEVLRAFGTLRAIAVPAGQSQVVMSYHSQAIAMCVPIMAAGGVLIVLLGIAGAVFSLRKSKPTIA